jgi:hypothetical protein
MRRWHFLDHAAGKALLLGSSQHSRFCLMILDLFLHSINELESFYVSIVRMQLDLNIVPVYLVMFDIPDVVLGCLCDESY